MTGDEESTTLRLLLLAVPRPFLMENRGAHILYAFIYSIILPLSILIRQIDDKVSLCGTRKMSETNDNDNDNDGNVNVNINDDDNNMAEANAPVVAPTAAAPLEEISEVKNDNDNSIDGAKTSTAAMSTAIFEAIQLKDSTALTALLVELATTMCAAQQNSSIVDLLNEPDPHRDHQTPLFWAMETGCFDLVIILLSWGASPEYVHADGHSILRKAFDFDTTNGNNNNVEALLTASKKGGNIWININDVDADGNTLLSLAMAAATAKKEEEEEEDDEDEDNDGDEGKTDDTRWKANFGLVMLLLAHGADVKSYVNSKGHSILQTAIELEELDSVEELLKLQLHDGDDEDGKGGFLFGANHALPLAMANGNFDVILLLLAHGADKNYVDPEGYSILTRAVLLGKTNAVSALLQTCEGFEEKAVNEVIRDNETALSVAVRKGTAEMVTLLLEKGADLEHVDSAGNSILMHALSNAEVVTLLLKRVDVDANATNALQKTPIMLAIEEGYLESFTLLLSHRVKLDKSDKNGNTPLLYAITNGRMEMAEKIITHQVTMNGMDHWCAPLVAACGLKRASVTDSKLEMGAMVNVANNDGTTPLLALCSSRSNRPTDEDEIVKVAKALLDRGAHIDAKDQANKAGLTHACSNHFFQLATLLAEKKATPNVVDPETGMTPLLQVLSQKREDSLAGLGKLLLANGADAQAIDGAGMTALMYACQSGYDEIVSLLLCDHGVDPNKQSPAGDTALLLSCLNNHMDIPSLLVSNGADVCLSNAMGQTPIIALCIGATDSECKLLQATTTLLLGNSQINVMSIPDASGKTPIMHLCSNKNQLPWLLDLFLRLCRTGTSVDAADSLGETALMIAAARGSVQKVEKLLASLADVNACNILNETALLKACEGQHTAVVEILLKMPSIQVDISSYGKTPLSVLCSFPRTADADDCINDLLDHGANPNGAAPWGDPPIVCAVLAERKQLAWLLICRGGDVNAVASDGFTRPILAACAMGHFEIVQSLVQMGADTNVFDETGNLPFMLACEAQAKEEADAPDIVHYLLVNGGATGVEGMQQHKVEKTMMEAEPIACDGDIGDVADTEMEVVDSI